MARKNSKKELAHEELHHIKGGTLGGATRVRPGQAHVVDLEEPSTLEHARSTAVPARSDHFETDKRKPPITSVSVTPKGHEPTPTLSPKSERTALGWLRRARLNILERSMRPTEEVSLSSAVSPKTTRGPVIDHARVPELVKRLDELDSRIGDTTSRTFDRIADTALGSELRIPDLPMVDTGSGMTSAKFVLSPASEKRVGVFKKVGGESDIRSAIPDGGSARRQIASYLISRQEGGKVSVPMSLSARDRGGNQGSLQVFRENAGPIERMDHGQRAAIPVEDLHDITSFSSRLYNLDGHLGNVLAPAPDARTKKFTPIDFDLTLPVLTNHEQLSQNRLSIGWQYFPQMNEPLHPNTRRALRETNIDGEANVLERAGLEPQAIALFRTTSAFWKEAAKHDDVTPGDLVDYLYSNDLASRFIDANETATEKGATVYASKMESSDEGAALKAASDAYHAQIDEAFSAFIPKKMEALRGEIRERNAQVTQAKEAIHAGKPEDAGYIAKILLNDHRDFRRALDIANRLSEQGGTAALHQVDEITERMKELQSLERTATFNALTRLAEQLRASGQSTRADAIQKWLSEHM